MDINKITLQYLPSQPARLINSNEAVGIDRSIFVEIFAGKEPRNLILLD